MATGFGSSWPTYQHREARTTAPAAGADIREARKSVIYPTFSAHPEGNSGPWLAPYRTTRRGHAGLTQSYFFWSLSYPGAEGDERLHSLLFTPCRAPSRRLGHRRVLPPCLRASFQPVSALIPSLHLKPQQMIRFTPLLSAASAGSSSAHQCPFTHQFITRRMRDSP